MRPHPLGHETQPALAALIRQQTHRVDIQRVGRPLDNLARPQRIALVFDEAHDHVAMRLLRRVQTGGDAVRGDVLVRTEYREEGPAALDPGSVRHHAARRTSRFVAADSTIARVTSSDRNASLPVTRSGGRPATTQRTK